ARGGIGEHHLVEPRDRKARRGGEVQRERRGARGRDDGALAEARPHGFGGKRNRDGSSALADVRRSPSSVVGSPRSAAAPYAWSWLFVMCTAHGGLAARR